ncbi:MAG TPA: lytic murein transglycosylase [Burkholderiaceae bacterium]|nr:lytic murein transglycosylase [Burkholderiaceae bacterium]
MRTRPASSVRRLRLVAATLASWAALTGCATAPVPAPTPPPAPPAPTSPTTPATATATVPDVPVAAASAPAQLAAEAATLEQRFAEWVAGFRADAHAQGVDDATLHAALDDVHYLPRVVELDRAQPEFTRPVWTYLDGTVSPQRVARGQEKLQQVRAQADDAAARYGVAAVVLTAIWGIETNYGDFTGSTSTIDALATLGFDGRRESWARGQLIAALKILQGGDIDRARMLGSWAGAMGQTQLLPSNFLAYAVDGDGDGRRDIWSSVADAMASTANFLARSGWRSGEPWGTEVQLPPQFEVARADLQTRQSSAQWTAEGVRTIDAAPLPNFEDGAILLPAGARGPAFLVGPNFRAILRYNNSTNYALAVSLLSQRLAGGPPVRAAWPRELQALSRSQLIDLQSALNAQGFDSGTPDGMVGPATREALRRFQRSIGAPADGYPTLELLQRLQAP